MARLTLTLLGGVQARLEPGGPLGLSTRKAQGLLAYLAIPPGRAHARDKLASLLWGSVRQESARASLRQAAFILRRALAPTDPPALLHEGDALALNPAVVDVDVTTFEGLVRTGGPTALERAASLYQGDLLAGFAVDEAPFEEWLITERERLRETALEALARLLAHQRKVSAVEAAVQTALKLLALDPLQEPVHRTLMRLYAERGRRGAALRQYQQCVGVLQRELGVEPEAETQRLYQEILRQRPASLSLPETSPAPPHAAAPPGAPGRRTSSPAAEDGLIGRETEVSRLREALAVARAGQGHAIAVIGEAGVGKSRLIADLVAEAERHGIRVLLGRSYESEQVLPFRPWVDALSTQQVMEDLADLGAAWRAELARLLPELGVGPGVTGSGSAADYLQLFEAVARAIGHLAARRPLLVVLEDLHWADEMSARLLAFVGRRLADWPVLVAVTARDEELPDAFLLRRALEDLQREGRMSRMALAPLSRADTLALVRLHARTGSEDTALERLGEQAWTASGGNPFVVVETVRAQAEGAAPLQGRDLALPDRVREIVNRRLERLTPRAQAITAVAAVIGRELDFALLQGAGGLGDQEAAEGVEELVRRRILHGVGDGFGFTHEWIRAVAYESLLGVRRQTLHRAAGAALEQRHAGQLDAVYDRLAHHYLQGNEPAKAAEYLTRFARKAVRAYAHEEAVRSYGEALRQAERLPALEADARRVDIVPRLTRSLMFLGRFEDARDLLEEQRERVETLDNPSLTGQYYLLLSHVHTFLGDRDRTVESARQAMAAAARASDEATMGKAAYVLAMEGWWAGDPQQGLAHGRRATELLERTTERWWLGQAHFAIAANYVLKGEFEPAVDAAARALAIGDALDDPRVQTPAAWIRGTILAMRGDWDEGIAAGRRSLDYSPDPLNRADALGWLGLTYLEKGDAVEAIGVLEQSVDQWSRFRVRSVQGGFRILLGYACLMRGDVDRAAALAEEGLALTRETRYRLGIGWGERLLALLAQRRGDPRAARAAFEQARRTFAAISAGFEAARTQLLLAEVCSALGDDAAATLALTEARNAFAALQIPRYVHWAEMLAGRRSAAACDGGTAEARVPRWASPP